MTPLRIAIVGCGLIGRKRALAASPHRVVVVADLDPSRAYMLAVEVGARTADRWQDVLADDVDVVVVATTHNALTEVAEAALRADKHVLIEKPGGRTAAEVQAIADLARARGLIAKVGFNHRFHPALSRAKELVAGGEFGRVLFIRAVYGHGGRPGYQKEWRFRKEVSGGGQLIDQGAHLLDLSRWYAGDFTRATGALRSFFWEADVEDNCFISLEAADGAVAWLHAGWTEWKNRFHFEIMLRDAKLEIVGLGGSYGPERLTLYRMLPGMGPPKTTTWEFPHVDRSWQDEMANLAAAVAGTEPVNGDANDAAAMLQLVEDIYTGGDVVHARQSGGLND